MSPEWSGMIFSLNRWGEAFWRAFKTEHLDNQLHICCKDRHLNIRLLKNHDAFKLCSIHLTIKKANNRCSNLRPDIRL